MLCFKAFLLLSLLSVVLFISPVVSARQLTSTTEDVAKTAEKPNKLDGYDDQGGYEYGRSGYGHEGYGGYGHEGYGHEGYGHEGYGHEGYGHEGYGHEGYGGYGHVGYGHESYGGYGHGGYGHEGYGSYEHDGNGHEGYGGSYLVSKEKKVGVVADHPEYSSRRGYLPGRSPAKFGGYGGFVQPAEGKKANVEETEN